MSDEHRLGNDGTEPSWQAQPDDSDDQMNEKDPGMVSNPKNPLIFGPIQ